MTGWPHDPGEVPIDEPGNDPVRRLHDDLACYYDQDAAARSRRRPPLERIKRRESFVRLLRDEDRRRVLDVGLGPGIDAVALQDEGFAVSGVDLSPEHVRIARAAGVDAYTAAAQSLPFADGSFDAIWSMSVLMHMRDAGLHDALAEFARVLVPGAIAAVGMWGGDGTAGINPEDDITPPRYFSWRTDAAIQDAIGAHAAIELFQTWTTPGTGGSPLRYQWCLARFL